MQKHGSQQFMEIPTNEIHDLEALLHDIHSALFGIAKYPLDPVTAESLSDRTLLALARLRERRSHDRQNPPG